VVFLKTYRLNKFRMEIQIILGDIYNPVHCAEMLAMLDQYMQDPMGGCLPLSKELGERIIAGLKLQPNYLFFLAHCDGQLAGFANCFVNFSTFKAKQLVNIHDIAIHSDFRKKGIGKALMEAITRYSEEYNFCKITLEVRNDNTKAQKLYKSLGFSECKPPMYFWEKVLV
jgi:GNAT superfamily N-acetyltransferase